MPVCNIQCKTPTTLTFNERKVSGSRVYGTKMIAVL